MDETDRMEKLYDVFKNLDSETQLVMLSTTTPNEKLGMTFKLKMNQINMLKCLHLAIPDQIHEGMTQFSVRTHQQGR